MDSKVEDFSLATARLYLTTMDFLVTAYQKGIMDEKECDLFIQKVKSKGSKLPCDTIKEFLR